MTTKTTMPAAITAALKPYAKALVGAGIAGLTAAGTALADGHVTALEWCGIGVATLGALGVVYSVPNKPAS